VGEQDILVDYFEKESVPYVITRPAEDWRGKEDAPAASGAVGTGERPFSIWPARSAQRK
jgi:hypothetical protein